MLTRRVRATLLTYRDARERLLRLRVIRTHGPLAGQFAEWAAAGHLRLRLVRSNVEKSYDAKDRKGQTYQIKGRIVAGPRVSTSFDFRRPMRRFDFFLGVLVSRHFEVLAIIRASYAAARRHARRNRGGYRLRWTQRSYEASWVDVLYRAEG
jgi:hypothetical protein